MKKIALMAAAMTVALISAPCLNFTSAAAPQTKTSKVISTLTSSNGMAAGKALYKLYTQFKADGNKLDLSNSTNITNLLSLATNIQGLKDCDTTSSSVNSFVSGLISGSSKLVNKSNSSTVLNTLSSLANVDLSSLKESATSAATTAATNALLSKLGSKSSSSSTTTTDTATSTASSLLSGLFSKLTK